MPASSLYPKLVVPYRHWGILLDVAGIVKVNNTLQALEMPVMPIGLGSISVGGPSIHISEGGNLVFSSFSCIHVFAVTSNFQASPKPGLKKIWITCISRIFRNRRQAQIIETVFGKKGMLAFTCVTQFTFPLSPE